VLRAVFKSVA